MAFYQEIRYCIVPNPASLGNGICQNFGKYNTAGCEFDGGDCVEFNKEFPNCKAEYPIFLGDGRCDGGEYDTEECGWDGGDCSEFHQQYPDCAVEKPILVGNGVCDEEDEGAYNTEVCGWDGGDCLTFWENYPNCKIVFETSRAKLGRLHPTLELSLGMSMYSRKPCRGKVEVPPNFHLAKIDVPRYQVYSL